MKRTLLILPLLALPAFAQDLPEIADTDGNGIWSLAELQTVYTDLAEEGFTAADTNQDGGVDAAELTAALAAGTVKPAM